MFLRSLPASHRFNLVVIALSTSVVKLPVFVGTAKVEIFFNLSSFLFFIFEVFYSFFKLN
jgi:hypothetical protein